MRNDGLLNNCRPLKDYMTLINEIRKNCKTMEFESAVDAAVTYCIEHDVLKTFLLKHRAEVKDVCITEYNEKSLLTEYVRRVVQRVVQKVVRKVRTKKDWRYTVIFGREVFQRKTLW